MLHAAMILVRKTLLWALYLAALGVLPKLTQDMGQAAAKIHGRGMMSLSAYNQLLLSGGKR